MSAKKKTKKDNVEQPVVMTEAQEKYILENWEKEGSDDMAKATGLTASFIETYLREFNKNQIERLKNPIKKKKKETILKYQIDDKGGVVLTPAQASMNDDIRKHLIGNEKEEDKYAKFRIPVKRQEY